ncbi:MAG: hypothetical protein UV79_C0023G0005 [candidate division TM6 bacterium GW2011_GWF2_43_17]|nr:MAG: hypothetical protein UV79_C0023G0005 [candidate division TM6 bacterium GW2011_GWF2_43_17]
MIRKLLFGTAILLGAQYLAAEVVDIGSLLAKFHATTLSDLYGKLDKPLIIDVFGDRCPNCSRFGPVFHKVGSEVGQQAYFVSFNHTTAVGSEARRLYNIQRIPFLIVVKDGSVRHNGVFEGNESTLRALLRQSAGLNV